MQHQQIEILETSFQALAPQGEHLVERFYERLFEKYPSVKPLFAHVPISKQRKKLLGSLVTIVENLHKPEELLSYLKALGQRHVGYRAKPEHYDAVGENLLAVMEEVAGELWTKEVSEAWRSAYELIKTTMLQGVEEMNASLESPGNSVDQICAKSLDNMRGNVILCDSDFTIIYVNRNSIKTLGPIEGEIKKRFNGFSLDKLVGTNIDSFHKDPMRIRNMLSDPSRLPHEAMITLGRVKLNLQVSAILNEDHTIKAYCLEWEDVTASIALDIEMARLRSALDNTRTNVLICDRDYTIVYANLASLKTMTELEPIICKVMPGFSAAKLVGSNIDDYHKDPSRQRRVLDDQNRLPFRTDIKIGPLTLDLNASAITSESGEYLGNIVEWMDVTAQKQAESAVAQLITAGQAGKLDERMKIDDFEGFYKTLASGINNLLDSIVTPLNEAQSVLKSLANGDLTKLMEGVYEGEFDQMKESVNGAINNIKKMVGQILVASDVLQVAAVEISSGNTDLSERTSAQASALEETSASMEEMTVAVKNNAANTQQADQLAKSSRASAEEGGEITTQAVLAIEEVKKSSKRIEDVLEMIKQIAFKTEMLSFNASIEAAHAGEHGKGFAVVAQGIKELANRSSEGAKEIKALIEESGQKVLDGSTLVNQSGETLVTIVNSIKKVTDIVGEISSSVQEQSGGIEQVNDAISSMSDVTQQNAALVEEVAAAAQRMMEQVTNMKQLISFFSLGDQQHTLPPQLEMKAHTAPSPVTNIAHIPHTPAHKNGNGSSDWVDM